MAPRASLDKGTLAGRVPGSARLVLALASLNILGFVDRQLVVALAPLLMADLGLSRAQVGLLMGVSFIGVFAVGTLVVGVLADRWNRPRLIALGLGLWSAATALTATAHGALALGVWRALVGIGEAALPATALSMVADRVRPARLALATGVYYAGVPIGYALSLAFSGLIGPRFGWRACFLVMGVLGLAGALLVLRLEDPPRRAAGAAPHAGSHDLWAALGERPTILILSMGGVLLVYASASSQHAITWLVTERGFDYAWAALASASVTLAAGLSGNLVIGAITDRARQVHPALRLVALAVVSAFGLLAAAGFYTLAPGTWLFLACWVVAQAYLLGWYGSLVAAVDERAPAGRHAAVLGFLLMMVNLLGVATGPFVTGLVGDRAGLTHALLWSLVPAACGALVVGMLGLAEWRASRRGSEA